MKQFADNIPIELRALARWIPVGIPNDPKCPACKGWQLAATHKPLSTIHGNFGFVCSVHPDDSADKTREDYLLLDFDHVLDDSGKFVNDDAEQCFNFVLEKLSAAGNVFCEYSMSGKGFHVLACPTPRKYSFAAQDGGTVWFGKHDTKDEKKTCPKLEIFVGSEGRQVVLTGNLYQCDKNARIPHGESVDALLDALTKKISEQDKQKTLDFDTVPVPSDKLVTAFATSPAKETPPAQSQKFRHSLTKKELKTLKNAVRVIPPEYIADRLHFGHDKKDGYVCPHCGNGSGSDGTGIKPSYLSDHYEWYCYKCNKNWDNVALVAECIGLSLNGRDFIDSVNKIANMFGIGYTPEGEFVSPNYVKNFTPPKEDQKPAKDYTNFYNNVACPNLTKFLAQCGGTWRGFTRETLEHFRCGYTDAFILYHAPAVIIPYTKNHYFARFVGDKDKLTAEQKKSLHEKYHTTGAKPIFNIKLSLSNANPICFVVESATDAMSIYQAGGYNVIAVSGSTLSAFMREQLKPYSDKKFIVMLDGDATGEKKKQELVDQLIKLGHQATTITLSDSYKDANDFLQADPNGLAARLTEIYESAVKFFNNPQHIDTKPAQVPAVDSAVEEWQSFNGTISPDVLPRLIAAKKYLDALTPADITAGVALSAKAKHSVALCKAYDCYAESAETFFVKLNEAKKAADNTIKKCEFDKTAVPDSVVATKNISVTEIKNAILPFIKTYTKAHKEFVKAEEQRKVREDAQRKYDAAQAERNDAAARLKNLATQDQCPERDAAIRDTIRQLCSWKHDKIGNPVAIEATQANIDLMFNYDPDLEGLFAYDAFQDADVFLKAPPWNNEVKKGDQWSDNDDKQLRVYLRRKYAELSNDTLVYDTVTDFANQRRFNVVKDYFKDLPAWDGKPRAETFFIDWNRAPDTPYTRAVTMNWLLGGVARIFYPGCEYQSVIVLQGPQGIGKDFNLKRLAAGWHSAVTDSLDSGDAVDVLKLSWIAVFEEMHAVSKSSVNAVKSFISRNTDARREKYGRRAKRIPRHCIFAITTNDQKFLNDVTGNRRYLILNCGGKQSKPVKVVRGERLTDDNIIKQIWAEVYVRYQELFKDVNDIKQVAEKLLLPEDITAQAAKIAEQHVNDNGGADSIIEEFVDTKIPDPVIWSLLSREQRRQFFIDGSIKLDHADLNYRRRARGGRNLEHDLDEIYKACHAPSTRKIPVGEGRDLYQFFGTEYRQHICAAEILDECFDKTDKRKSPTRINELLARLDGWSAGKSIGRDPAYGNQRNVYWRDDDDTADDEPNETPPPVVDPQINSSSTSVQSINLTAAGWDTVPAASPDDNRDYDDFGGEPIDPDDTPF